MKKIFSLVIATIMLLSTFCYASSGDSTNNESTDDNKTYEDGYQAGLNAGYSDGYSDGIGDGKDKVPVIKFIETNDLPEVGAGEELSLTVNFTNDSTYTAYEITLLPDLEGTPIIYERPLKYTLNKSLRGGKEGKASFSLKVSEDAKIGTYSIKFKIDYKNGRDETFSREETAYFKVNSEKLKPIITISNVKTSLETINAGDTFTLTFDLNNIGGSDARNVELSIEGFGQTTLVPVDARDYNYIGTIKSKETSNQSFDIIVSSEIATKDNALTANITYKDALEKEYSISKKIYIIGINIEDKEDKEEGSVARPKMIISSYGLNPTDVVAGDIFTLGFTFKNTSREKKIRNLKITISSENGAFIITRGSNTFYVEEMEKQAMITREIELKAKQDLTSNSYKVNIDFDYEDFDGNQYTATETLNIPVIEYSKLVINSVYAGEGYVNSTTNLSFDYVNMGKATVSNLTASVEGDYESVQSINYIGNLNAGTSDYYDIEVRPTKEGINYGTLILAFEDSSGGIIEVRKEFEGNAFAEDFFEPTPNIPIGSIDNQFIEPKEDDISITAWQIILWGIGSFLLTFIITKIITTKIIRRKLEEDL